jgi:histidine ammonia-lyase
MEKEALSRTIDPLLIGAGPLEIGMLQSQQQHRQQVSLSDEARQRVIDCRTYLEQKLQGADTRFYGINTGFGSLCNIQISDAEIAQLQLNLVRSHACGTGEEVPAEIVRLMMLLKIQSLSFGHSGVRIKTVDRLLELYNQDVLPVVYQFGSLGASGDLAPLAHLSLPLIGEGEVRFRGEPMPAAEALSTLGLSPMELHSKEGLALLNGTQFSAAYAVWGVLQADYLYQLANWCAAIALDAFNCRLSPFDERLHAIRPHPGQVGTAATIRELLAGSELAAGEKKNVQDPYAFRCVPQVHGASKDALEFIRTTVHTEINSVTDNPNIFPESDAILSGGNFHAQPLAIPLDLLAIAMAELGSISERRTYQLISGQRELPAFLTPRPGLHSGLMIPQYTAASIVSKNKQLCTPASVDSIVSSNGQEDHVSMAANAATKVYRVLQNVEQVFGH